jgi:hypothetical protein
VPTDIGPALRERIIRRAGNRCEYCRIHQDDAGFTLQVDHILSRKHGGQTVESNLALACLLSNRFKGSDISSVNERGLLVRLLNPRQDRWGDHLEYDGPRIFARSEVGEATVRTLKLNAPERVEERRVLQSLRRYPVR